MCAQIVLAVAVATSNAAPSGWAHGHAWAGPHSGPAALAGPHAGPSSLAGPHAGAAHISGATAGPALVTGAVAAPSAVIGSSAGPTLVSEPSLGLGESSYHHVTNDQKTNVIAIITLN